MLGAVFDGDLAGPGPDDPQLRNRYGVNFRINDPAGRNVSHGNLVSNAMNVAPCTGYESDATYLDAAPIFHLSDGCSTYGITMAEELDQYGAAGIHKIFQRLEPGHETRGVASSEQMTGA